jgi:hypothetical protein
MPMMPFIILMPTMQAGWNQRHICSVYVGFNEWNQCSLGQEQHASWRASGGGHTLL